MNLGLDKLNPRQLDAFFLDIQELKRDTDVLIPPLVHPLLVSMYPFVSLLHTI